MWKPVRNIVIITAFSIFLPLVASNVASSQETFPKPLVENTNTGGEKLIAYNSPKKNKKQKTQKTNKGSEEVVAHDSFLDQLSEGFWRRNNYTPGEERARKEGYMPLSEHRELMKVDPEYRKKYLVWEKRQKQAKYETKEWRNNMIYFVIIMAVFAGVAQLFRFIANRSSPPPYKTQQSEVSDKRGAKIISDLGAVRYQQKFVEPQGPTKGG